MKTIGQSKTRVDAYGKVTGVAKYTSDLEPKNLLHAKILHSTIANGLVKSFDLEDALQIPGVLKILTCFDVPDTIFPTAGHPWSVEKGHQDIMDRKLLNQRVRYYGDDIAVVIAETELAATKAVRAIKVKYEEYKPIVSIESALAEDATILHPEVRETNVIAKHRMTLGGVDFTFEKGYEEAKKLYGEENLIFIDKVFDTPRISHCHIELPVSFAYVDFNNKITVVSSTQIPHIVRRVISQALNIPIGRIRVIKPYIGGGFGNKQDVLYEPLNAFLTLQMGGRAVKLEISREETIVSTRTRHQIIGKTKLLATKDGRILARKLEALSNNGAYASHGHAICANCGNVFKALYKDEIGTEVECMTVYTSSPTAGAMRGYGIPQAAWFAECLLDDYAYMLDKNPCDIRLKNCMRDNYMDPANGIRFHTYGLKECIEKGRKYIDFDKKWEAYKHQTGDIRKGVGMAIFCYKTGVYPISLETAAARMVLNQDGSIQVFMGATEIGQGADTVFSQIASDVTGISYDKVFVISTQDTDSTPFDTGAYASRQTYVSGAACKDCGEILKEKILNYAAYMLNHDITDISKTVYKDIVHDAAIYLREHLHIMPQAEISPKDLDIIDSKIVLADDKSILFGVEIVADTAFYSLDKSIHLTAETTHHCKRNTFSSGACFVELEVDIPLGLIKVTDIINVHDSGMLINPKLAAAQVHGGMSMGLGYGLSEEMLIDEQTGKTLNDNLLDFKIPTAMDTPDLNVEFIELDDPTGPFGNKSLGEPPVIPVSPAIRNAILNATGVGMDVIPMTSQRLIEKFKEKGLIS